MPTRSGGMVFLQNFPPKRGGKDFKKSYRAGVKEFKKVFRVGGTSLFYVDVGSEGLRLRRAMDGPVVGNARRATRAGQTRGVRRPELLRAFSGIVPVVAGVGLGVGRYLCEDHQDGKARGPSGSSPGRTSSSWPSGETACAMIRSVISDRCS